MLLLLFASLAFALNNTYTVLDVFISTEWSYVCEAGIPDFKYPCWAKREIAWRCDYNVSSDFYNQSGTGYAFYDTKYAVDTPISSRAQQICYCSSQYWEALDGCERCTSEHGFSMLAMNASKDDLQTFSSSYCAVTNSPAALTSALSSRFPTSTVSSATWIITDTVGRSYNYSLYYNSTGTISTAATAPPVGSATVTIFNGQIVATSSLSGSASPPTTVVDVPKSMGSSLQCSVVLIYLALLALCLV